VLDVLIVISVRPFTAMDRRWLTVSLVDADVKMVKREPNSNTHAIIIPAAAMEPNMSANLPDVFMILLLFLLIDDYGNGHSDIPFHEINESFARVIHAQAKESAETHHAYAAENKENDLSRILIVQHRGIDD